MSKIIEQYIDASGKPATIHDVALAANVAVGTVSRYLNGRPIRESNRQKIEETIRDLSFVRNLAAATIRSDASRLIGFLVSSYDQFQIDLLSRLTARMQAKGRLVVPITHDGSPDLMQRALQFFGEHRVDTLVASGDFPAMQQLQALSSLKTPVILFNNNIENLLADRVMFDDAAGMKRAVDHLIALGHRRIGLVSGLAEHSSAVGRLDGYRQAIESHGISYDPALVAGHSWAREAGYHAADQLLGVRQPPTAMVCGNYLTAMGALELFGKRGISVPRDMSFISFGDVDFLPLVSGGIDAVAFPVDRMVDSIDYLHSHPQVTKRRITLDCEMVLRGSSRAI